MIKNIIIKISFIILVITVNSVFSDDQGLNNYKNKNFEEAKKYYEQILEARGNDAEASLGLGASQYQLGDIPNASKSFEDALRSDNSDIQDRAYYNLGNALYSQQKVEESLAYYRKALELNPNDEDAKFNYELAKYITQQQEQDQEDQNDQQDQQQNDSNDKNDQDNEKQDTDKNEPDKQEDENSDSNQEEKRDAPKSQKQMNAEAILDALKDDEKIHQKVKMSQQSARKFEKDW